MEEASIMYKGYETYEISIGTLETPLLENMVVNARV